MIVEQMERLAEKPIFFERNRVFRVYQGGKLFHDFFGDADEDSNFPEEWVASGVLARNQNQTGGKEGVSRILGTELYLDDLIEACPQAVCGPRGKLDVLVKVLDSAIRLPMQAHPDRAYSKSFFQSDYGKAESWMILATREDGCVYFGFREKMTKERFREAVERSERDKNVMTGIANRIPVRPGDVFMIPPKTVHAIGAGCLLIEVQEPTDFTIQPERWCGDKKLTDYEMYLGLDQETALDCFDYSLYGPEAVALGKKTPITLSETDTLKIERLIGPADTPCFSANRYRLSRGSAELEKAPSIQIVTEGRGILTNGREQFELSKSDYFLLPYHAKQWRIETEGAMEWIECLPPM